MLLLSIKTLAGRMCALPPCHRDGFTCHRDGFRKYASLFKENTLLSVLCTPALFGRKVLILQGCIVSLKEVNL
jgi:hypothetical protein